MGDEDVDVWNTRPNVLLLIWFVMECSIVVVSSVRRTEYSDSLDFDKFVLQVNAVLPELLLGHFRGSELR